MLKNWLVNTEQKKNFVNSYNYLKDKNRPSHYHSQIETIWDNSKNILKAFDDRTEYRQANGLRGGGVRNQATSFVFSLPNDVDHPTAKQWKEMMVIIFKEMAVDINKAIERDNKKELQKRSERPNHKKKPLMPSIKAKDLYDHSVAILHDESAGHKHSHVHVNISNVIACEVIKPISQLCATYAAKKGFNRAVKSVLGHDNLKYVSKNPDNGDKPLYVARQEQNEKVKKELSDNKIKLSVIKSLIEQTKQSVKSWSKLFFTNDTDLQPVTASKADEVESLISKADEIDQDLADSFDNEIDDIENNNPEPLPDTKVSSKRSSKRKKRRRKF